MSIVSLQVFQTADGQQFSTQALAEAHQFSLDNQVTLEAVAESFVNASELVGRARTGSANKCVEVVSFLVAQGLVDLDLLAAHTPIAPSEDLAARLEAERVAAEAKAAAREVKTEEVEVAEEADLSDFS